MKIGASVGPSPESISEVPEEFDFVELAIGEMEIDPDEIDREKLREDLDENDLDLIVHLPFRQPLVTEVEELNNSNKEYLKRLLSFCKEIDVEKAVVHANNRYGTSQEKTNSDELKKVMKEISEIGETKDVQVVFENVPGGKGRGAVELEELGEIARELDLNLCLDTGHAYAEAGQEGLKEFIEGYGDLIRHLHVQDSMGGEDSHVAVNHGDIDWNSVGDLLSDFRYTATMEIFSEDMEYQSISRRKFLEFTE